MWLKSQPVEKQEEVKKTEKKDKKKAEIKMKIKEIKTQKKEKALTAQNMNQMFYNYAETTKTTGGAPKKQVVIKDEK